MMNIPSEAWIGIVGITLGALGKAYTSRQDRSSKEDSALARVLERRDEDCRRLQDRLSAATTESDLRGAQVADLAVRVEHALEQVQEMRDEMADMRSRNEDCEKRNATLTARVFRLERHTTPPGDTPAVGLRRPIQHEDVGHE
jgi:DNA repair exonuclease SbcCD ATPase subunit